jgi:predicted ATPase
MCIASHLKQLRVCLVMTYRVDELTRQNHLYRQLPALIRESGGLRVDLGRLRQDDLATLVSTHYALPEHDASRLVDFLVGHSDGNPFFAIELLRALEHRGREGLWWTGSGWRLGELAPIVVPALVRQVIDARLDRLGTSFREPLAIAAVIGQDVSLDLWREVSGLEQDALIEIVETALEWHVVVAAADGTRIRFVHALTREALYESIHPPRRRLLHRKVAETLIAMQNADPDAVAYHLHQAGDPRTADWMIRAGERAQRAYAWLTAWDRFRTAADALADVPGEELTRAAALPVRPFAALRGCRAWHRESETGQSPCGSRWGNRPGGGCDLLTWVAALLRRCVGSRYRGDNCRHRADGGDASRGGADQLVDDQLDGGCTTGDRSRVSDRI